MNLPPEVDQAVEDAAASAWDIAWSMVPVERHVSDPVLYSGAGTCLPIAFYMVEFLKARGIPARVVEAEAEWNTPVGPTYIGKGIKWRGHAVVYLPTHRVMIDASTSDTDTRLAKWIRAQIGQDARLITTRPFDHNQPTPVRGVWNGASFTYSLYPKERNWKQGTMPWDEIRAAAKIEARS